MAVVVATRDRCASLLRTLERLEALPESPQIVVVDNASSDGTAARVRARHPHVELVELSENIGGAARTIGAHRVDTPFVAFSDDDSWWAPGALALAAAFLERHGELALVAARILVGPDEKDDPTCALMARSPLPARDGLPGTPVLGFVACGAVVRRLPFLEIGGFDRRFAVGGEEQLVALDLAQRGWHLAYVPDIVAYHDPSPPRAERRRTEARNALWLAWLRRPAAGALRTTARSLARGLHDPAARAGVAQALRGLPWVVRERQAVNPELELSLRLLEA